MVLTLGGRRLPQALSHRPARNPAERFPLTDGESNDIDAVLLADGNRIYFTSDRSGANNIYSLDLETGEMTAAHQLGDRLLHADRAGRPGGQRAAGLHGLLEGALRSLSARRRRADHRADPIEDADGAGRDGAIAPTSCRASSRRSRCRSTTTTRRSYGGRKFFLEDIGGTIGVSDDQTFIAQAYVSLLGLSRRPPDHRGFPVDRELPELRRLLRQSVEPLAVAGPPLRRSRFLHRPYDSAGFRRGTGGLHPDRRHGSLVYPFNIYHRVELGGGYSSARDRLPDLSCGSGRHVASCSSLFPRSTPFRPARRRGAGSSEAVRGALVPCRSSSRRSDDFPILQAGLVGDTAVFAPWGRERAAAGGRRRLRPGSGKRAAH